MTGGYNNFSRDQQFQISSLVLQLQDVMTVDTSEHETITNKANRLTIDVPNAIPHVLRCKNCAKPMHEVQANVASKHK